MVWTPSREGFSDTGSEERRGCVVRSWVRREVERGASVEI
jgi:hypothetical protein